MKSSLGSMDTSQLLIEPISAASNHRNQMPLPHSPGASCFGGSDVTTILQKYECLQCSTRTDTSSEDVIYICRYYRTEGLKVREQVIMMRGDERGDWAGLKMEMLDAFRYTDSQPDSLVHTRQYVENLGAEFGGGDDTDTLECSLHTEDHISGAVTERGMMVEYVRTVMLLHALPKRLRRMAITKRGLNILEPHTFEYSNLIGWITSRITAVEALTMFEAHAPTSPSSPHAPTAPTCTSASPVSLASLVSLASPGSLASPVSLAPTISSPPATPMTHMTSLASTTSPACGTSSPVALAHPAPFAPTAADTTTTIPMAAKVPSTTVITITLPSSPSPTARECTIRAAPPVPLAIIRVEEPRGPPVHEHRFLQPRHSQESALPNRQVPNPQHCVRPRMPAFSGGRLCMPINSIWLHTSASERKSSSRWYDDRYRSKCHASRLYKIESYPALDM
jgi:hypothetical protein